MESSTPARRILVLAANSRSTTQLRLDQEVREIKRWLRLLIGPNRFEVKSEFVVRSDDLHRALLDFNPHIVHLYGDDAKQEGLATENEVGQIQLISLEVLARLFGALTELECILFKGCYSQAQAKPISQYVNCIGLKQEISNRVVNKFVIVFYAGLTAGLSVQDAYKLGCKAIEWETLPEHLQPILEPRKNSAQRSAPTAISKTNSSANSPIQSIFSDVRAGGNITIERIIQIFRTEEAVQHDEVLSQTIQPLISYCPYQSLSAFQEEDAPFFFGRDSFITQLVAAVQTQPLVTVIGPSGSGKSSVVFAGLLPYLREQKNWLVVSLRPQNNPFYELAEALVPLLEPQLTKGDQRREAKKLAKELQQEDQALQGIVKGILQEHPNYRLLLVVDQFEELYTLCPSYDKERFLDALLATVRASSQLNFRNCTIVLTLRADFYNHALSYRPLRDLLQQFASLLLSAMNREELLAAIEMPAQKLGMHLEADLTRRILDDVGNKPGNLPLLEFALTQLWERQKDGQLTHHAYGEIGGVEAAIARYAEQIYIQLNEHEKAQSQHIFLQLVYVNPSTEPTRRLATRAEVGDVHWDLVIHLASKRLVVTNRDDVTGTETVEIVHEALIREWSQLRLWLKQDQEFRIWQQGLRVAMHQWNSSARDEGALLRGKPLADAEDRLQKRPEELVAEQEYIKASLGLQEREKEKLSRQRKRIIVGLTGGLAGALGLAAIAGLGWWQATNAATNSRLKALVAESELLFTLARAESSNLDRDSTLSKNSFNTKQSKWEEENAKKEKDFFQEALLKAIRAGRELQQANGVETETKFRVLGALRQAVYTQAKSTSFTVSECQSFKRGPFSLAWSSDQKMIACVNYDGTVRLWDGRTGKKTNAFQGDSEWVDDIQFSPDGKLIASGTVNGTVKLWERATGKEIRSLNGHLSQVKLIRFSPNGQIVAAGNYDGSVIFWEVATGRKLKTLPGHSNSNNSEISTIIFSPNSQFLVSGYEDSTLKLWEIATGKELKTLRKASTESSLSRRDIAFSLNSQIITYHIGEFNNLKLQFWNIAKNKELKTIPISGDAFFSSDAQITAVIDDKYKNLVAEQQRDNKNSVSLWDSSTGKKIKTLNNSPNKPFSIDFSSDGTLVAIIAHIKVGNELGSPTPTDRFAVTLWSRTGKKLKTFEQQGRFLDFSFSPNGQKIAISSFARVNEDWRIILKLWDVSTGRELKILSDESIVFTPAGFSVGLAIRFSSDGQTITAIDSSGVAKFFNSSTGKELNLPNINNSRNIDHPPYIVAGGKRVATLKTDGSIQNQNRSTGEEIKLKRWDRVLVSDARINDNAQTITTVNWYGKLQERELATGKILNSTNLPFQKLASTLKFSPDGRRVAAAMSDETVRIWDTKTNKEINSLKEYAYKSSEKYWFRNELKFSPDNRVVAALSGDHSYEEGDKLELWEASTGKAILFPEIPSGVVSISFSPDSDQLAILKIDNTIQLWKLSNRQLVRTIIPALRGTKQIQFNEDGTLLFIIGSADSGTDELKLLDIAANQEIASLKIPTGSADFASFNSDGKTLFLQSDNQFFLLNFDLEDLLGRGCDIARNYLKNNPNVNESDKKLCDFSIVR